MLESLRHGAGTIHELNLVGAFPERAPYRPRELYAVLKATPLFDVERGQWNWWMSEGQIVGGSDRPVQAQLLGVLVEAQFNSGEARVLYEKLKTTLLYDHEREGWNAYLMKNQALGSTVRYGAAQLLGVLAEARFNPEGARVLYEKQKATPLYDGERGQWNMWMSREQGVGSAERFADVQLLGVLGEAQFDVEGARALYAKLKTTPLYDAACRQWNTSMAEQELRRTSRFADVHLLAVLVEAQFDAAGARVLYEQLKATPLYDAERRQWNLEMSAEQALQQPKRDVHAQLLGVLVEAKLLSTLSRPLAEAVPPLPVTEAW